MSNDWDTTFNRAKIAINYLDQHINLLNNKNLSLEKYNWLFDQANNDKKEIQLIINNLIGMINNKQMPQCYQNIQYMDCIMDLQNKLNNYIIKPIQCEFVDISLDGDTTPNIHPNIHPNFHPNFQTTIDQQKHILMVQDQKLDLVDDGVKKLNTMAVEIGTEIQNQDQLLTDTEIGITNANKTVGRHIKKLDQLIEKIGGRWSITIIIILVIVLVVLVYLIFVL